MLQQEAHQVCRNGLNERCMKDTTSKTWWHSPVWETMADTANTPPALLHTAMR